MKGRRLLVSLLVTVALVLGLALPVAASSCKILVYTGEGALDEGYTNFGVAAGKVVDTKNTLPTDLSPYCCIILPVNGHLSSAFSVATTTALTGYVQAGGTIIALAEYENFSPGAITAMNGLATALSADLSIISANIDLGFHTTTNIDSSPFTVGVSSIRYAATSEVQVVVTGDAHSLVRSQGTPGTTFIGADKIGSGWFILSGDSNVFSDFSDTGYTEQDNGVLVSNICGAIEVDIDIKPGSDPNSINLNGNGVVPVGVFGTATFDVNDIDVSTVLFGVSGTEAAAVHSGHIEDLNDDGVDDMVLHFREGELGIPLATAGNTTLDLLLTGQLNDGRAFEGKDEVRITPNNQESRGKGGKGPK